MTYTKNRRLYIAFSVVALLALMVTIFLLSAQTSTESAETSGGFIQWLRELLNIKLSQDVIRTVAHFCEFGLLGFLASNLFLAVKDNPKPLLSIALSWGYAWTDEIHQIFVDGRAFQLIDLTVDLCGIGAGAMLYFLIIKIIKAKTSSKKL